MDKKISKRAISVFAVIMLLFSVTVVRLFVIATDTSLLETANEQSSFLVRLYRKRGTVYDCNMQKLTNIKEKKVTVFSPTQEGIMSARRVLSGEDRETTLETLKNGQPATVVGDYDVVGATVVSVPDTSLLTLATHLLGYTDSTGHGVCGVELGMDYLLFCDDFVSVKYVSDSTKNILPGIAAEIDYGKSDPSDVILTIDARIQSIVQNAIKNAGSAAAVVIEADTGKIRAMASEPTFDISDLSASLENEEAPFLNRTLSAYSVGSVFKPLIAAVAIENGLGSFVAECNGQTEIDGRVFKCHKSSGHGTVDMKTALSESCNVYFYKLGNAVGGEKIYDFAKLFSFGEELSVGCGLSADGGEIFDKETLTDSVSAVANFSIGQGKLTLSPLSVSLIYQAIFCEGNYYLPTVLEGVIKDGEREYDKASPKTSVMTKQTAELLEKYLISTVESGTGQNAYVQGVKAGGKTGTAQTGWIKDGRSILNGWFCGFAEIGGKKFVITVLKEDVKSGSSDCAPIFAEITQKIYENIF